jgi:hypothetical protein
MFTEQVRAYPSQGAEALLAHGNQLNGLKELEARMSEIEANQPKKRIA